VGQVGNLPSPQRGDLASAPIHRAGRDACAPDRYIGSVTGWPVSADL